MTIRFKLAVRVALTGVYLAGSLAASLAATPLARAQVPGVDAFFDSMAIDVAPGRHSRFVAGDNLDGYYAGLTQGGAAEGYVTRAGTAILDYAASIDGRMLVRAGAAEQVLPWGHRLRYANGASEELALLSKRHALAMAVGAARPAILRIAPQLAAFGAVTRVDDAVLVMPAAAGGLFVAFVADCPFDLDQSGGVPALRTRVPAPSFTVIAAVGPSAHQALARARALDPANAIAAEKAARHAQLTRSYLATSDATYNRALNWAKASADSFVVEEFGAGIWAGLPWFRDNWGRDTFIALPGTLLVSGQFDSARAVMANFARYQQSAPGADAGRIPNRVSANAPIIYNTVDGTPWMLREALEYIRYTGDTEFAAQMHRLAVAYFDGAIAHSVDADGLLRHDSADTWMDARIANREPWSARGPRAVEIQALWYTALQAGAALARQAGDDAHARQWSQLAEKAQRSFLAKFWDGERMADRLREDGSRDLKMRPNQLMLVSIPDDDFIPQAVQARVIRSATNALLYPYGIASLSQDEAYFHPRHENPDWHHKDAAYHQGTIWGWNAGFTVSALNKFGYQDHAWRLSENLGHQMLGIGPEGAHATLGTMSELLDAVPQDDGSLKPSGTWAQSWSVAEYARNGYQDYLGFHPDLLAGRLDFAPALPRAWSSVTARLPFGAGAAADALDIAVQQTGSVQTWRFSGTGKAHSIRFDAFDATRARRRLTLTLPARRSVVLRLDSACRARGQFCATLDGAPLPSTVVQASQQALIGTLAFRQPPAYVPANFPMLRQRDALQKIILDGAYR